MSFDWHNGNMAFLDACSFFSCDYDLLNLLV